MHDPASGDSSCRGDSAQVDVFSLGIILFEVFAKSVTGAALLTTGDMDECEMYAWKVRGSECGVFSSWKQSWLDRKPPT